MAMTNFENIRYGFGRVDVSDIVLDLAKHHKASGEALRPIGLAPLDVNELTSIVEDVVKGVRAHLDRACEHHEGRGDDYEEV